MTTYIPPIWIHTGAIVSNNQTGEETVVVGTRWGASKHETIVKTCEADRCPIVEHPCDEFVRQFTDTGKKRSFIRLPIPIYEAQEHGNG